jgi:hypothetical protein
MLPVFLPSAERRSTHLSNRLPDAKAERHMQQEVEGESMKQRYVQSFLMVSAAFFAINAPIRANEALSPLNLRSSSQKIESTHRVEPGVEDRNPEAGGRLDA